MELAARSVVIAVAAAALALPAAPAPAAAQEAAQTRDQVHELHVEMLQRILSVDAAALRAGGFSFRRGGTTTHIDLRTGLYSETSSKCDGPCLAGDSFGHRYQSIDIDPMSLMDEILTVIDDPAATHVEEEPGRVRHIKDSLPSSRLGLVLGHLAEPAAITRTDKGGGTEYLFRKSDGRETTVLVGPGTLEAVTDEGSLSWRIGNKRLRDDVLAILDDS